MSILEGLGNFFGGNNNEEESAEAEKARLDKAAENIEVEHVPDITIEGGVEDDKDDTLKAV